MSKPLKLSIPNPCDVNWGHMSLEEKSRHCNLCSQSVYELEEHEESEVVDLLQQTVCVRVKSNASGHIKTRTGFSSILLLSGLLACGETIDDPDLVPDTEKPVEVLKVTPGESVKAELQGIIPKKPPHPVMGKPVMGKIAAPVRLQPENVEMGEVEMVDKEPGTGVHTAEKKSTEASKDDCQTD